MKVSLRTALLLALATGIITTTAAAAAAAPAGNATACKSIPGDPGWPSAQEWDALNRTIGGRLLATVPVGSVCHVGGPFDGLYNASECAYFRAVWNFSVAHFPYPGEVSFPWGQACDPYTPKTQPCELGGYVSYSINVTGPADVVAGISFAEEQNVRLVIKNTGHDYLGKSTGKGGLALWTHNLKTRELIPAYNSSYYRGPAIKLGAGVLAEEAYTFADSHGYRVVGGTCATVGIAGGYSQGGGHSTLSGVYGLGADNVLEWEVVTADGRHLVASPTNDARDLYWALSGGGGGTFAVVLSMTARLHVDGPVGGAYLSFDDTRVGGDAFWDAVGAFHAALPPLLSAGTTVLYSVYNRSFDMFSLTAPGATTEQVLAQLGPLRAELDRRGVPFAVEAHASASFLEHFARDLGPLPYGPFSSGQVTGSRLVPRAVVQDPARNAALTGALRNITATGDFFVACQALDVRGGSGGSGGSSSGSSNNNNSTVKNAVLPAWRDAATHCIVVGAWDYEAPRAAMQAKESALTDAVTPALEAVTPGSGTYLNEANFRQRDFQAQFYGANYARLLEVKRRYDPRAVFYAPTAVGSEAYEVDGEGRLCRASGGASG